jgi:hypothetical protein
MPKGKKTKFVPLDLSKPIPKSIKPAKAVAPNKPIPKPTATVDFTRILEDIMHLAPHMFSTASILALAQTTPRIRALLKNKKHLNKWTHTPVYDKLWVGKRDLGDHMQVDDRCFDFVSQFFGAGLTRRVYTEDFIQDWPYTHELQLTGLAPKKGLGVEYTIDTYDRQDPNQLIFVKMTQGFNYIHSLDHRVIDIPAAPFPIHLYFSMEIYSKNYAFSAPEKIQALTMAVERLPSALAWASFTNLRYLKLQPRADHRETKIELKNLPSSLETFAVYGVELCGVFEPGCQIKHLVLAQLGSRRSIVQSPFVLPQTLETLVEVLGSPEQCVLPSNLKCYAQNTCWFEDHRHTFTLPSTLEIFVQFDEYADFDRCTKGGSIVNGSSMGGDRLTENPFFTTTNCNGKEIYVMSADINCRLFRRAEFKNESALQFAVTLPESLRVVCADLVIGAQSLPNLETLYTASFEYRDYVAYVDDNGKSIPTTVRVCGLDKALSLWKMPNLKTLVSAAADPEIMEDVFRTVDQIYPRGLDKFIFYTNGKSKNPDTRFPFVTCANNISIRVSDYGFFTQDPSSFKQLEDRIINFLISPWRPYTLKPNQVLMVSHNFSGSRAPFSMGKTLFTLTRRKDASGISINHIKYY